MRATIEHHEGKSFLPPIEVMVSLGGEDMSIKVGHKMISAWLGGEPPLNMAFIFFTLAKSTSENPLNQI